MSHNDPSLEDFIKDLWVAKTPIVLFMVIFLVFAAIILLAVTPRYRASMIVAPADGYALGDYASSVSEGESLTIPFWRPQEAGGISTDFHRFVYTIQGPAAASILLKDSAVLAGIAQDGGFARKAQTWTSEELSAYLQKNVKVQVLGTTPLRKLTYQHPDPKFAADFLRKIHLVADQLIRRDRRRQSESRIEYLKNTLQKTMNPDHRRGIADLLMQQEHIQMLANLDEPYAAIVVEPPSSTPRPVWPDKLLFFFSLGLLGAVTGYIFHHCRIKKQS